MSKEFRALFFAAIFLAAPALVVAGDSLRVGDRAPDFTLPAATKDTLLPGGLSLSGALRSSAVILAFYPADWSGGCTTEMCALRDNFASLAELGATVYGISGDYIFSHRQWARQYHLPFALLSDHDHAVARTYASYNAKTGLNRRTVYLVSRQGIITYIDLDYKAGSPESFDRLKAAVQNLQS